MPKDIFQKRINYKPFEYPDVMKFINAINQTFWVHSEVDFTADKQDFNVSLNEVEKNAVKNALLAIAQVEVAVKTFWGKLYDYLPKPEFAGVGGTYSECEFRHSEAYSRLLDVIDASDEFEKILKVPQIKDRVEFLSSYLKNKVPIGDKRKYALALIIFSLFIENVSLFSQFAIMLSFSRFKGLLKNTSNVINWTATEEQIHAQTGIYLFNIIKKENPEIFDDEMKETLINAATKAIEVEKDVLEWIFEKGSIDTISKECLIEFMKDRVNSSFKEIGIKKPFKINKDELEKMKWFSEEINVNSHVDFFAQRPVEYSKHTEAITEDSLF